MSLTDAMGQSAASDVQLVARSRDGEIEAFTRIVERYQSLVRAVSLSVTADPGLSDDVAQETFLAAWRGLDSVRESGKLRAWLCGTARHLSLRAVQRRGREVLAREPDSDLGAGEAKGRSPLDEVLERESEELLWRCLEHLPERYRLPMILVYREQRSVAEAAALLGVSRWTVQQRLSRGRRRLRDRVADKVERALSQNRPAGGLVAAIAGALTAGTASPGLASTSSGGAGAAAKHAADGSEGGLSMFGKIVLGVALTGAAASTAIFAFDRASAGDPKPETSGDWSAAPSAASSDESEAAGPAVHPAPPDRARPTLGQGALMSRADNQQEGMITIGAYLPDEPNVRLQNVSTTGLYDCFGLGERELPVPSRLEVDLEFTTSGEASARSVESLAVSGDHPFGAEIHDCLRGALARLDIPAGDHLLRVVIGAKPEPAEPPREVARSVEAPPATARGDQEAPVTIIVYGDFQCRFCGKLVGTLDQLFEEYPQALRLVMKQLPRHEEAELAARAALAAAEQDRFWEMHDLLFQNPGAQSRADVRRYAEEIGLDLAAFDEALESERISQLLAADRAEAESLGVVATPTLFINGERIRGARDIQFFREEIDAYLE